MTGFYNITTVIKNQLLQDPFCNTVTIGDLFEVDLRKQTIFPLSHIIVNSADLENNVWRFNMSVISMDIVDKSKELTTDHFTGNDNEHDVLNTQHAVLNRLLEVLRRGSLRDEHYHLDGNPTLEPFTERFENYLAGWTATFDVLIPNDMTACDGFETATVICENGVVTIRDAAGNVLHTVSVTSGGTASQTISDSTYTVEYENGTPIESGTIPAEGSVVVQVPNPIVCADATYTITDDSANVLYSGSLPSGGNLNQTIQDSTVTITDDSANTLYTLSVNAEGSASQTIQDSTAVLKTTGGATLSTTSINAEASADIVAPDTSIQVNGVAEGSVVAGSTLDVQLSDSGGTVTPTSVTQVGNDLQIVLPDGGSPLDSDAKAFLDAALITDATITSAIDTLVVGLKTNGIWHKMRCIYPFVGGTATTHKFNLIDPRDSDDAFRLAFTGGWVHSATGAKPNGTNATANTFFNAPFRVALNSIHLSYYSRTNVSGNQVDMGVFGTYILYSYSGTGFKALNSAQHTGGGIFSPTTGMLIGNRTSSTSEKYYHNGALTYNLTVSSSTYENQSIRIASYSLGGSPAAYSSKECAFATIGEGLTDTEADTLETLVQAFQTSLSRQV